MTPKDMYENCRAWLQFSETKNGFALAFCGAILAAETSLLAGVGECYKQFVLLSMFFVTISAILSLASFIPQGSAPPGVAIYFGHIAQRARGDYVRQVSAMLVESDQKAIAEELLEQCHSLSLITVRKLKFFYASVGIAAFAIIGPLISAAVWEVFA